MVIPEPPPLDAGTGGRQRRLIRSRSDTVATFFEVQGGSPSELADEIAGLFTQQKHRLECGTRIDGVYGIGSDLLRLLAGGFVKRNKFHIQIQTFEQSSHVTLKKAMNGWMGGALGA